PVGLLATLVLCNQKFDTFVYSREPNTDMRAKIVTALGATYFSAQNATLKDIIKKQNVPGVAKTPEVVANANSLHTQPASTVAINNKIIGNLDVIFDATGASRLAFEATDLLGFNGIFVWTGIPGRQDPVDINAGTFMQNVVLKNQNLVGSVNAGHEDFRSAIQNLGELSQSLNELLSPLIKRYTVDKYADLLLQPPVANTLKSAISFS
ncbi:MAG: zinc-binding dehydrogenase family oxidoreductase, partial [uncultured bacterium]